LHYTRVSPVDGESRYLTSTAIFIVEVVKLCASLSFALYDICNVNQEKPLLGNLKSLLSTVFTGDSWKLMIPAVLYTFQSSLLYTAISNLDVATFQVNYQLKILTTALFSVKFLGKQLSSSRWLSLALLAIGIAIVQIPDPKEFLNLIQMSSSPVLTERAEPPLKERELGKPLMDASKGLLAVLAASITSGLTGVYFEKVVKDSTKISIWTRNVQLSFYSLFPALFLGVIYRDGQEIQRHGFFVGYSSMVWLTILLQVFGGIMVAICIARLDNILKNFAISVSIVCSFLVDVFVFKSPVTVNVSGNPLVLRLSLTLAVHRWYSDCFVCDIYV
jgi:UDP-sugar transporter A1/2/3